MSCCSPLTHGPGVAACPLGMLQKWALPEVLPESLWGHGGVCVSRVLHVLLSAPGSAPGFLILLTVPDAFSEE